MNSQIITGVGALYDSGEKLVSANIRYNIFLNPPTKSSFGKWQGNFVLVSNNPPTLENPNDYEIVLDDSRKGKIILSRMQVQNDATIHYEFQGNGPLQ